MTALLTMSDTAHSNKGLLALGGQGKKKAKQIVFAINITVKSLFPVKSKLYNRKKEKKKKDPRRQTFIKPQNWRLLRTPSRHPF